MDAAGGIYLPPKSLPEGGWTRPAGLTFRRRTCRREDGHGWRGLSSAEELAGERMDAAGEAYLPPKNLPRQEDGCGRRDLSSAEELAGGRMDTAGGAYLPPKSLPEGGWTRQAGLIFRRRACRREDGHGWRGLSSAEELAEAGGER